MSHCNCQKKICQPLQYGPCHQNSCCNPCCQQGPTGPTGPTGPRGATGLRGATGSPGLLIPGCINPILLTGQVTLAADGTVTGTITGLTLTGGVSGLNTTITVTPNAAQIPNCSAPFISFIFAQGPAGTEEILSGSDNIINVPTTELVTAQPVNIGALICCGVL